MVTLQRQYRMCSDIMLLPNTLVYSGQLQVGSEAVAAGCLELPRPQAALQVGAGLGTRV